MANEVLLNLIDLDLLRAFFDEWMNGEYFNVSLNGTVLTVTDKQGNTNTLDIAAAFPSYRDFLPSGPNAARGLVPSPETTQGNTRFLCENGNWEEIPSSGGSVQIVNNLVDGGATKALSAEMGKTLKGLIDQGGGSVTIVNDLTTGGTDKALSAEMGKTLNTSKQDKLVSGTNIKTINNESILGSGNITIQGGGATADEEDLTNASGVLKLKNRTASTGRKGMVILRQGTALSAQMVSVDTIYVIRYAFDISGETNSTLTVPQNCVLRFEGGSISGGTLNFNNTTVSGKVNIQSTLSGTLANKDIYVNDFLSDISTLDYKRISEVVSVASNANIHFNGVYSTSVDTESGSEGLNRGILLKSGISYIGNGCTIYQPTESRSQFVFNDKHNYEGVDYVENILIDGFNFICTISSTSNVSHHFATIALGRAKNCRIENCSFNNWIGDAIAVAYLFNPQRTAHVKGLSENILVKQCNFNGPGTGDNYKERNAISVLDCDGFVIENCSFKNMGASSQPSCIDFEPEKIGGAAVVKIDNVEVKNCFFDNVYAGVACVAFFCNSGTCTNDSGVYSIKNNTFRNCRNPFRIQLNNGHFIIQNNVLNNISGNSAQLFERGTIDFIDNSVSDSTGLFLFGYTQEVPTINIKNNTFKSLLGTSAYNFYFSAVTGIINFDGNTIYDCGDSGSNDYHVGILTISSSTGVDNCFSFTNNLFYQSRGYFCGVYRGSVVLKDLNTTVILKSSVSLNPYNSGIDTEQLSIK